MKIQTFLLIVAVALALGGCTKTKVEPKTSHRIPTPEEIRQCARDEKEARKKQKEMDKLAKTTPEKRFLNQLTNFVVAANEDGLAIDPIKKEKETNTFTSVQFSNYVHQIFKRAEQLAESKGTTNVKVLVHVHGGLNGNEDTLARVERFSKVMMAEPDEWYYPVFVRWPSGPFDTYGEHLVVLRGNKSPNLGKVTAPFIVATDLLQFAAHAPLDWFFQTVNAKDRTVTADPFTAIHTNLTLKNQISRNWKISEHNYTNLCKEVCRNNTYRGEYYYSFWKDRLLHGSADIVQMPIHATAGTLGQGTIAQAAWANMKRRTSNMIHPAPLFDINNDPGITNFPGEVQGRALGQFFVLLSQHARRQATNTQKALHYEITFVGHSMGSIVLNKVFTHYRNDWIEGKFIKDIVYMAGADSVNNTLNAVKPLLLEYNRTTNSATGETNRLHFYNLTLNRVAEISERPGLGFIPRGSLLEYIDQHLEEAETAADRTVGSEVNVFQCLHMFADVEEYCDFKSFDRINGFIPGRHGEFNDCPFWRRSFREAQGDACYHAQWTCVDPVVQLRVSERDRPQKK